MNARAHLNIAETRAEGLIDTNIAILWPRLDVRELPLQTAVSAVTVAELAAGVHAATDAGQRALRLDLLQRIEATYDPFPFDVAAARIYGRIAAAARAAGRSPRARVADQMIAAIAAAQGLPLYTTNTEDFAHCPGIVDVVGVTRPAPASAS